MTISIHLNSILYSCLMKNKNNEKGNCRQLERLSFFILFSSQFFNKRDKKGMV